MSQVAAAGQSAGHMAGGSRCNKAKICNMAAQQRPRRALLALLTFLMATAQLQCSQARSRAAPSPKPGPRVAAKRGNTSPVLKPGNVMVPRAAMLPKKSTGPDRSDAKWYFRAPPRGTVEVCHSPGNCTSVPRFPVDKYVGYECGLFYGGRCEFKNIMNWPKGIAADRRPAVPKVNEEAIVKYNKYLSSQNIMPLYQHTNDFYVLEAAKQLLQAGATSFKFDLKNQLRGGRVAGYIKGKGPVAIFTNREMPYQQLCDLPFTHFFMWTGKLAPPNGLSDVDGWDVYKGIYELTSYLLKRYSNTGKTFFIGHWEGDWTMRDKLDKNAPCNPTKAAAMVKLLSDKQRAIDDAKKNSPWAKNVWVWHYAEANLVENSIMKGPSWCSMVNTIIPQVRPVIDYVSVSVGGDSLRDWNPTNNLHLTMDYARSRLPKKAGIPEPRAFMGEFYFPLRAPDGQASGISPNSELQKQRAMCAAASGMAWGSPHMLWWQFQDNEKDKKGSFRGFWLVDSQNKPTPLWQSMQQYFKDANDFVRSAAAATGQLPSNYAFRNWAVKRLIELSGRKDGCQWKPNVRTWS